MKTLIKKIGFKKVVFIIMPPITMFLFLYIQNSKLKGLTLLIGSIIFIFASDYNKRSKP